MNGTPLPPGNAPATAATRSRTNRLSPLLLAWVLLLAVETLGQVALKFAGTRVGAFELDRHSVLLALSTPWLWLGLLAYALHLLSWIAFLSLVDLSKGMLLASINMVAIMLGGRLLFREKLTPLRVTGIALVSAGVAIVGAGG